MLAQSGASFVSASERETQQVFLEGYVAALEWFRTEQMTRTMRDAICMVRERSKPARKPAVARRLLSIARHFRLV